VRNWLSTKSSGGHDTLDTHDLIRSIQYLRALAAMLVVWVHALYVIPGVAELWGAPFFGGSGVDLFFVISGFIMVITTARTDLTPVEFFGLRIVRVAPLYWLATLATLLLSAHAPYPPAALAKSLLFIPYAAIAGNPKSIWPIVQQGWTLNYEMFFYALFALSLAAPRRARLPGLVLTLGSLVIIGKLAGPFASPLASVYLSSLLLEFAVGMMLAHAWLRDGVRFGFAQSLALIVFGLYCIGAQHSRPIVMGGAFLILAGSLHGRIRASKNRPLLELGNASYAIYLTHQFVLDAFAWLWLWAFPLATQASSALFMALGLVLSASAGWLCYRIIERPLTHRLRGFVKRSAHRLMMRGSH
jgi:exopolysaccharide production protein ExoZ